MTSDITVEHQYACNEVVLTDHNQLAYELVYPEGYEGPTILTVFEGDMTPEYIAHTGGATHHAYSSVESLPLLEHKREVWVIQWNHYDLIPQINKPPKKVLTKVEHIILWIEDDKPINRHLIDGNPIDE